MTPALADRDALQADTGRFEQFSVTTGTVFEATHVPLSKWLMAIH